MLKFMAVMVPLVLLINGFTKGDWRAAFFFALAVAVGLTPEMLPMIVSVCLSSGALAMSRKKVIVKRLNSIQNFGGMDVLCTDKTGTLTEDRVVLMRHCDVAGHESDEILLDGYLISYFQTGLKNLLDRAILDSSDFHEKAVVDKYKKLDEIPFDFTRRMMSVLVESPEGKSILLTKGAPEEVFLRCSHFELDGTLSKMDAEQVFEELKQEYDSLSDDGFRVLAVATKELSGKQICAKEDERDLVLKGYVAFLDPPKETAGRALAALHSHGVSVKILTGDNALISRKVCKDVGLSADPMLLGGDVERMSDIELAEAADKAVLFARLSPAHKERVIRALRGKGHVVGFMGDGINDAPALRVADVGISVDNATDIAKESADLILLEKNLMVLEEGVIEGRKVFANIVKYIRMGASSNFGNMFSVLGASAFLPFLPMAPIQVLTNNLLYDFSQVPIPADAVDEEQVTRPRPWNIGEIKRFILFVGPISSIFDYVTFFVMLYLFNCWDPSRAPLFQTGWFVAAADLPRWHVGRNGFILQKLEGQGRAWIELSGEPVHYTLAPGQTLIVHPGHVGMFEGSVQFTMTRMPGIANMAFGADGFQLVALTGPGQIWLQSMPLPVLAHSLQPYLARQDAPQTAEAGAIGGIIGNIMRGQ